MFKFLWMKKENKEKAIHDNNSNSAFRQIGELLSISYWNKKKTTAILFSSLKTYTIE